MTLNRLPKTSAYALVLLFAPILASCGANTTPVASTQTQNVSATNTGMSSMSTSLTFPNPSAESLAAFSQLKTKTGVTYGSNGYLDIVAASPLPAAAQSVSGTSSVRSVSNWASSRFNALSAPVTPQWVRAYASSNTSTTAAQFIDLCLADTAADSCKASLSGASYASINQQADGTWVLVLAAMQGNLTVTPTSTTY